MVRLPIPSARANSRPGETPGAFTTKLFKTDLQAHHIAEPVAEFFVEMRMENYISLIQNLPLWVVVRVLASCETSALQVARYNYPMADELRPVRRPAIVLPTQWATYAKFAPLVS